MRYLILSWIVLPFCLFAQLDGVRNEHQTKHTIGIAPFSFYPLQWSIAHGINYQLDFGRNFVSIGSEGTLFKMLDSRKWKNSPLDKFIPFLNLSSLSYSREVFALEKNSVNKINFKVAYNYFQHGSKPLAWGYWDIDSIGNGGVETITGFQTHIASIGFSCSNIKFSKSNDISKYPKIKNTIEFDYLLGFAINLKGVNNYPTYKEGIKMVNTYPFKRHGARFKYKFEYYFKDYFGVYTELDLLLVPFIDYTPNYEIFVPRGGEGIIPFLPSIKVGVNFCINSKGYRVE